jgi:1-acyl-sn-glycerol-3-phosphate acyltransferase
MLRKSIANAVLAVSPYKIRGEQPPTDAVCLLVAAPHTSTWDLPLMLAMAWGSGLTPKFLMKKEAFRGPMGPIFKLMGGIPTDRANPAGLVEDLAARARAAEGFVLVVAPEGTRKRGTYWKSGFWRIAVAAEIPIVLSYLDGPTKTGGFGPTFQPSGDIAADMELIREFYADKRGVRPARRTPPIVREEETVAEPV